MQRAVQVSSSPVPTPGTGGDPLKPHSKQASELQLACLQCTPRGVFLFKHFGVPPPRKRGVEQGGQGGSCNQGWLHADSLGSALSPLHHEQKQILSERKKYNTASLSEQSSHDIRNHKAEAHARKEHGERGISWTLALGSNNQLLPSMHTQAWHEGGKTASKHSALKGSEAARFAL